MNYNGIDFNTYLNDYPDENGFFGKCRPARGDEGSIIGSFCLSKHTRGVESTVQSKRLDMASRFIQSWHIKAKGYL